MDEVDQVIDLEHEVQEGDDRWPVGRVEEDDQVLASDRVTRQVGQQRDPHVEEAVGTDQPGQRLEDVRDLLEDRRREVGYERPQVQGDVADHDLRRADVQALVRRPAQDEVDEDLGRDVRQDVGEVRAEGAEVDARVRAEQRAALHGRPDDVAEAGAGQVGEGQHSVVDEARGAEGQRAVEEQRADVLGLRVDDRVRVVARALDVDRSVAVQVDAVLQV